MKKQSTETMNNVEVSNFIGGKKKYSLIFLDLYLGNPYECRIVVISLTMKITK